MMAGKFVIDDKGDVYIKGDVYVAGKVYAEGLETKTASVSGSLFASLIKPIDGSVAVNLSQKGVSLQSRKDTPYKEYPFQEYEEVASIDASGSATFKKINIATANTASPSAGFGEVIETEITTNATAGQSTLEANTKEIIINNQNITKNSLIYITPTSNTANKVLFVKNKKDGVGGYFTVAIDEPVEKEIRFNWWIIN